MVYKRGYPVTVNHASQTEFATRIAKEIAGEANVHETPPLMGAEDFAYMLEARPGAFIFCGNGDTAGLHHPEYNFNDDAIVHGTSYWIKLVENARHRSARRPSDRSGSGCRRRTEHVLEIRRHQPARLDVRLVDHLDQRLVASHRALDAGEDLRIEIEIAGGVRNPHVGDRHAEAVERTARHKADEADAAVQIEVDQIAVRRAVGDTAEQR